MVLMLSWANHSDSLRDRPRPLHWKSGSISRCHCPERRLGLKGRPSAASPGSSGRVCRAECHPSPWRGGHSRSRPHLGSGRRSPLDIPKNLYLCALDVSMISMNPEERFVLLVRNTEEVVTSDELRELLEREGLPPRIHRLRAFWPGPPWMGDLFEQDS